MLIKQTSNGKSSGTSVRSAFNYILDDKIHKGTVEILPVGDDPTKVIKAVELADKQDRTTKYQSMVLSFSAEESKKLTRDNIIGICKDLYNKIFLNEIDGKPTIDPNDVAVNFVLHSDKSYDKNNPKYDVHVTWAKNYISRPDRKYNPINTGYGNFKYRTPEWSRLGKVKDMINVKYGLNFQETDFFVHIRNRTKKSGTYTYVKDDISKQVDLIYKKFLYDKVNDPNIIKGFVDREHFKDYLESLKCDVKTEGEKGTYKTGIKVKIDDKTYINIAKELGINVDIKYNKPRYIEGGPANIRCINNIQKVIEEYDKKISKLDPIKDKDRIEQFKLIKQHIYNQYMNINNTDVRKALYLNYEKSVDQINNKLAKQIPKESLINKEVINFNTFKKDFLNNINQHSNKHSLNIFNNILKQASILNKNNIHVNMNPYVPNISINSSGGIEINVGEYIITYNKYGEPVWEPNPLYYQLKENAMKKFQQEIDMDDKLHHRI